MKGVEKGRNLATEVSSTVKGMYGRVVTGPASVSEQAWNNRRVKIRETGFVSGAITRTHHLCVSNGP